MLVDGEGNPIGTAPKSTVHGADTPLHLAFSSYVFDRRGRVLLSRRAGSKLTWPDAWTNSCCGHPLPGEPLSSAVIRRLGFELGLDVESVDLVLPGFSYRAVMDNGTVENELCPVYRAVVTEEAAPNAEEVGEVRWEPWTLFAAGVMSGSWTSHPGHGSRCPSSSRSGRTRWPGQWPTPPPCRRPRARSPRTTDTLTR